MKTAKRNSTIQQLNMLLETNGNYLTHQSKTLDEMAKTLDEDGTCSIILIVDASGEIDLIEITDARSEEKVIQRVVKEIIRRDKELMQHVIKEMTPEVEVLCMSIPDCNSHQAKAVAFEKRKLNLLGKLNLLDVFKICIEAEGAHNIDKMKAIVEEIAAREDVGIRLPYTGIAWINSFHSIFRDLI